MGIQALKTLLLLWAVLYVFLAPTYAHDWGGTLALVHPSLIRLTHIIPATETTPEKIGTCTGFVIGKIDNSAVVMTAHHCLDPALKANDTYDLSVMMTHEETGIAILRVPGLTRPNLKPNRSHLKQGHMAAGVGFAFSYHEPLSLPGYIVHPGADLNKVGRRWLVFDACFIHGMSGGPIVDFNGRVVGIIQSYHPDYCVGFASPINDVWELTRPYWDD